MKRIKLLKIIFSSLLLFGGTNHLKIIFLASVPFVISTNNLYANEEFSIELGSFYQKKGNHKEAIRYFSKFINHPSGMSAAGRAMSKYELGDKYGSITDYEKAISLMKRSQYNNPELSAYYYKTIGNIRSELKNFNGAIDAFNKSIDLNYDHYVLALRGAAKYTLNQYVGAINDYSAALQIDPQNHLYLLKRGEARLFFGNYDDAIRDLDRVINFNTKAPNVYYYLGLSYFKLQKWEKAVTYFSNHIKRNRKDLEAFAYRSTANLNLKNNSAAIKDQNKVIRNNFNKPEMLFQRGVAKLRLKKSKSACKDLEESVLLGWEKSIQVKNEYCE